MSRENEVIKRKLTREMKENEEKIKVLESKINIVKYNRLDLKIAGVLVFSLIAAIPLFPMGIFVMKNLAYFIIPYKLFPYLFLGLHIGSGIILEKLFERKLKLKNILERFSKSKTELEKITEETRYDLEKVKLQIYNKTLQNAINSITISEELVERPHIEQKDTRTKSQISKDIHKKNRQLESKLNNLDISSTRFFLKETFHNVRNTQKKLVDIGIFGAYFGGFCFFLYILPTVALRNSVNSFQVRFLEMLTPFIIGSVIGTCYAVRRNQNYKKVFQKFNLELGKNAIPDKSDDRLDNSYTKELNNAIVDVWIMKIQLEQENIKLENKLLEEEREVKEELPFSYKANHGMEREQNLIRRNVKQEVPLGKKENGFVKKKVKLKEDSK